MGRCSRFSSRLFGKIWAVPLLTLISFSATTKTFYFILQGWGDLLPVETSCVWWLLMLIVWGGGGGGGGAFSTLLTLTLTFPRDNAAP